MAKVTPPASAAPAASAAPGTSDESAGEGKGKKSKKVFHPALKPNDEGKATATIDEVPEDFDPTTHKPLRKANFTHEHVFLRWKADNLEAEAKKLREEADVSEKLGSSADRAKAKKLRNMQDKMAQLRKQLEEQGIDVDQLLADS